MLIPRSLINFVCVCVCVWACTQTIEIQEEIWQKEGGGKKDAMHFCPAGIFRVSKGSWRTVEAEDFMIAQMWDGRVEKEESQSTAGSRYSAKKLKKKKNEEKWRDAFWNKEMGCKIIC